MTYVKCILHKFRKSSILVILKSILQSESSVAAGAKETATGVGFAGYTTFEEVTKDVCSSASISIGTEGRLIDSRDGKIYWIAKQKDGLCWMTQNLDYAGYGDVATNFANTDTTAKYWDPGDYIYVGGHIANNCNNQSLTNNTLSCRIWMKLNDLLIIINTWSITDDPDFIGASSYPSTDGRETCTKVIGSYMGDTGQYLYCNVYYGGITYIEHYHVGNYYNWMAATKDTVTDSGNANDSICPNGWSLPTGGEYTGEFYNLLNEVSAAGIIESPYSFVYGGYIVNSTLYEPGNSGYYWSSTARSASSVYRLTFTSGGVNPSNNANRFQGLSVRCVAR